MRDTPPPHKIFHFINRFKAKIAVLEGNRHIVNYIIYFNSLLVALLAGMIFILNQTEVQKYMDIRQNISQMKEISESYELILTKAQVTLQPETENLKKLATSLNEKKDNIKNFNNSIDDATYTQNMRYFVDILDKRLSARKELTDLYHNLAKTYRDYHFIAHNAEKILGDNIYLQLKVKHIMLDLEDSRLMGNKNNRDDILKNIHSLRLSLLEQSPDIQGKVSLFSERAEDIVKSLRYIDTIRASMQNDGYNIQLKKIENATNDKMHTEKIIFKGKLFLLFIIGGILLSCQIIILSWFFINKHKTNRIQAEAAETILKSKSIVARAKQYALEAQREQYKLLKNFCEDFAYILRAISNLSKSIHAYSHLHDNDNEKNKYGLRTLCASIEALEGWLNNYLTIHTAHDEWREVKKEIFHLSKVIDDIFVQTRFYASTREHQMALYYADIPKKFMGDADYITHIYTNMVYIILKWSVDSPIKTSVDYIPAKDEDSAKLIIEVSDISSHDDFIIRNELFHHEESNNENTSLEDRFISAALYFSRQIGDLLGAYLTLSYNDETKENILRVEIPVSLCEEDNQNVALGVPILQNKKALIVSPYPNILNTLEKQLTLYGMTVSAIGDHYAAIGHIIGTQHSGESFDIIILDHRLPDIDATSLIKIIRENTILGLVHIIVVTTEAFLPMLEEWHEDIDEIMTKPVKPDMLHKTLEKFIEIQLYGNTAGDIIEEEDNSTKRFLAIMNEDLSSSLLKLIITRQNYHIDIATTALQIMEALDRNIYDFVLISNKGTWIVPENIIKDIRRHHTDNKDTVMILVYDDIKKPYQKKLIKAGFDDFIKSPLDKTDFLDKIFEWNNPTERRLKGSVLDNISEETSQQNISSRDIKKL